MPNLLESNIHTCLELKQLYEDSALTTLDGHSRKLKELFTSLLESKGEEYGLLKNTQFQKNKLFSIRDRIKTPDSFYEKLIRKNLGLAIDQRFELSANQIPVSARAPDILNALYSIDDVIGLRIVTELKKDCEKVYKLLLNSSEFLSNSNIQFFDLDIQPQKMQNGLDIFRIKGKYQNLYCFELQIKSRIDEAWGDMDHSLFYKDYSISPIKDTVQATMNNVGGLLDEIENLLYDLRESGSHYYENAEHIKFQEDIENAIGISLLQNLSVQYKLKDISPILQFLSKKLSLSSVDFESQPLLFDYLNIEPDSRISPNYKFIREKSYSLIIIEAVFISWKQLSGNMINEGNYSETLDEFLVYLIEYLADTIEEQQDVLRTRIKMISDYVDSPDIFLSAKKAKEVSLISKRLENSEVNEDNLEEIVNELKMCFLIKAYDGKLKDYISSIEDRIPLSESLISIKQSINHKNGNILEKEIYRIANECLEIIRTAEES